MATPPSAWTGEKPRKAGNGAGRGSAARSGEKVVPISPTGSAQDVHRTPPHSVEAEQGVLGSMLISPRETIAECVEKINEEYFYVPAHRTIYDVLVDLWNAGQAIDLITFTQVLRDRNLLDSVGGAAFVTNLFTFVPTAANVQYYLEIVRDKYILRANHFGRYRERAPRLRRAGRGEQSARRSGTENLRRRRRPVQRPDALDERPGHGSDRVD